MLRFLPILLAATLATGACTPKATLDNTQVETVKVEGRLFEVRVAPTDVPDEYRMLVVRATLVINPDPETERARGWNVAKQYMDQTCKERRYQVLDNDLTDYVNLQVHFRCVG